MYNDFIQTKDKRFTRQFGRVALTFYIIALLVYILILYLKAFVVVAILLAFVGLWHLLMSWCYPIPEVVFERVLPAVISPFYPLIFLIYKFFAGELPPVDIIMIKTYWNLFVIGIQSIFMVYVAVSFFYNMIVKLQVVKILRPWPLAVILSSLTLFYFFYNQIMWWGGKFFICKMFVTPLIFIELFLKTDKITPTIIIIFDFVYRFGPFFCYAFILQSLYILRQAVKKRTFFQRIVGGDFKVFVVDTCKVIRTNIKWIPRNIKLYLDENDWMNGNAAQVGFNAISIPKSAIPSEEEGDEGALKIMILEYVFGLRYRNYYSNEITRILLDILLLPVMLIYYFCYLQQHFGGDPTIIWIYKLGQKIVKLNNELCAAPGSTKLKWKLMDLLKDLENSADRHQALPDIEVEEQCLIDADD